MREISPREDELSLNSTMKISPEELMNRGFHPAGGIEEQFPGGQTSPATVQRLFASTEYSQKGAGPGGPHDPHQQSVMSIASSIRPEATSLMERSFYLDRSLNASTMSWDEGGQLEGSILGGNHTSEVITPRPITPTFGCAKEKLRRTMWVRGFTTSAETSLGGVP